MRLKLTVDGMKRRMNGGRRTQVGVFVVVGWDAGEFFCHEGKELAVFALGEDCHDAAAAVESGKFLEHCGYLFIAC